jgi:hypothetical protein
MAASIAFLVPEAAAQTFSSDGTFTLTCIGRINSGNGATLDGCSLNGTGRFRAARSV